MPARNQLSPKLDVVVDLAVQHHNHRPILVVDRLVPGLEVDHSQALDAKCNAPLDMNTT